MFNFKVMQEVSRAETRGPRKTAKNATIRRYAHRGREKNKKRKSDEKSPKETNWNKNAKRVRFNPVYWARTNR
jgi:hypothetical protein